MTRRPKTRRSGLSLLEVLVALAIFLVAVGVLTQIIGSGRQAAFRANRQTKAALLCESKLAEVVAGIQPLQSMPPQALPDVEAGWMYSVMVLADEMTEVQVDGQSVAGLSTVMVTVTWNGSGETIEYTLSRLILDPRLRIPAPDPTITADTSTAEPATGGAATPGTTPATGGNQGGR